MVYHSFLDDSKDQHQSKMFVAAGFCATKDDWGKLRASWVKRLNVDGLDYFKTSEYKMLTGQFAKFKTDFYPPPKGREKARQIRGDLQSILQSIPAIVGIGVCLPMDAYNKVASRPEAGDVFVGNPYRRALESLLFETVKFVRAQPGKNAAVFVHDDAPDFDELRNYYMEFKEANPRTAKFMHGFTPLSDKEHPPLQAADMAANLSLEKGLEFVATGERIKKLEQLDGSIRRLCVWDEGYLLTTLKKRLETRGCPIPLDLQDEKYN